MRKATVWFLCLCFLLSARVRAESLLSASGANGAALLECETGRVLCALHETERLPIASTTKIMTALLVLEHGDLDTPFTVDPNAIRVEGSSMGLREGDTVTLRALLWGMLLPSGNDAANAAAVRTAGSLEAFVERMNERAAELGLADTRFSSPSGLELGEHYSTALDLARLACFALQNETFAEMVSSRSARVEFGDPPSPRTLYNHNRLLSLDADTIGVKTGFTKAAGRCLVSAARRGGLTLVAVTLGCPDDFALHARLCDEWFDRLSYADYREAAATRMAVAGGGGQSVPLVAQGPFGAWLSEEERAHVRIAFAAQPLCFAPVAAGEPLGTATLLLDGRPLAQTALVSAQDVPLYGDNRSISEIVRDFFSTPDQQSNPFFALHTGT